MTDEARPARAVIGRGEWRQDRRGGGERSRRRRGGRVAVVGLAPGLVAGGGGRDCRRERGGVAAGAVRPVTRLGGDGRRGSRGVRRVRGGCGKTDLNVIAAAGAGGVRPGQERE